jgi:hypothetical protein
MISRITIRTAELNDREFNAQSDDTESFSTKNLKNLAMSFNNCLLDWASFAIADKFEFWFTNCSNKWACLIVKEWTINASNEVRIVIRELFTQNSIDKAKEQIKSNSKWMTRWKRKKKKKEKWWIKILREQINARVRLNASSNSRQTKLDWLTNRDSSIDDRLQMRAWWVIWWDFLISDDKSLNLLFSRKEKKSWCYHLKPYAWEIHESTVWWKNDDVLLVMFLAEDATTSIHALPAQGRHLPPSWTNPGVSRATCLWHTTCQNRLCQMNELHSWMSCSTWSRFFVLVCISYKI